MPVINKIKYPDTPKEVAQFKDRTFVTLFDSFWRSQATANDNIFAQLASRATAKNSHEVFEKSGLHEGKCLISLSKQDQTKIKGSLGRLGHMGTDVKKMLNIVKDMHGMVENQVQAIALAKFYKGPTFKEYHRKSIYNGIKPNKQMAKVLQIDDPKVLKQFQFHMMMDDDASAEKLLKTYSKGQELKKNAPSVVKKLMRQNGL